MTQQGAVTLVCPVCRGRLTRDDSGWTCGSCARAFVSSPDGHSDFLVGSGFADQEDVERGLHEEKTATVTVEGYLIPLLRRLFACTDPRGIKVLDVGCGVAKSVDLLRDAGYDAWGVDSGHRVSHWARRRYREHLVLANGQAMPFPDGSFDFIFCAGVIEHVGCEGDARHPSPGYEEERLKFGSECVRVARKGGYLNFTCPNRLFPIDLWHRNTEMNPFRFHWPWDPFLFSKGDFKRLFVGKCGCASVGDAPIRGYWGFLRLNRTVLERMGCRAARLWFDTIGSWPLTRGSFANPWLSVLIRK